MRRSLAFLFGSAIIAAVFAGIYYAPENLESRVEGHPAFNLAAGEVRQTAIQPTAEGTPVVVHVEVLSGVVDLYTMDKEWATVLADQGSLRLDRPFSFDRDATVLHANSTHTLTLISDGMTWKSVVFDNSDNYYEGDAASNETAQIRLTVRFVEEEERSLVLGYIAAAPSVLLVVVTFARQYRRHRRSRDQDA